MNAGFAQPSGEHGAQLPNAEGAKVTRRTQKEDPKEEKTESANFDNDFSHAIIGAAVEVQRVLGVGLLESAYASAMAIELKERELHFERDVAVSAQYKGYALGTAYRADFIVEHSVIVELKAIDAMSDMHRAQLLSYLRLSNLKLGLLINMHAFPVVKGIHRLVNKP